MAMDVKYEIRIIKKIRLINFVLVVAHSGRLESRQNGQNLISERRIGGYKVSDRVRRVEKCERRFTTGWRGIDG